MGKTNIRFCPKDETYSIILTPSIYICVALVIVWLRLTPARHRLNLRLLDTYISLFGLVFTFIHKIQRYLLSINLPDFYGKNQ